jgi:hypothetical protein
MAAVGHARCHTAVVNSARYEIDVFDGDRLVRRIRRAVEPITIGMLGCTIPGAERARVLGHQGDYVGALPSGAPFPPATAFGSRRGKRDLALEAEQAQPLRSRSHWQAQGNSQ